MNKEPAGLYINTITRRVVGVAFSKPKLKQAKKLKLSTPNKARGEHE